MFIVLVATVGIDGIGEVSDHAWELTLEDAVDRAKKLPAVNAVRNFSVLKCNGHSSQIVVQAQLRSNGEWDTY